MYGACIVSVSVTPAPQVGDRFADRYELRAPLRGDEVVRVFLAFDHHAGREVTLFLFDSGCAHPSAWSAFTRVVASAAAARVAGLLLPQGLSDPAPVPPYCLAEVQVARGFDRLRDQGPLPWERAFTLGERVAEILHKVHAATGVAHRALTPARCAITVREDVKVFDYGVAELMQGRSQDTGYRAPEQQAGAGDARSDVYALGVILFEFVAGQRPSGSGPHHLRKLVPVPRPVDELLARALAREPVQRFADLAALRSSLRELLGLGAAPPDPVPAAPPAQASAPVVTPAIERPPAPAPVAAAPTPSRVVNGSVATAPPRMVSGAKSPSPPSGIPVGSAPPSPPARPDPPAPPPRSPPSPPSQPTDRTEVLRPAAFAAPMSAAPADRTEVLGRAFALPRVPVAAPTRSPPSNSPVSADRGEGPVSSAEEHVLSDTTDVFHRPLHSPVSTDRTEVLGPSGAARSHDPPADRTEVLTPPARELLPVDAPPQTPPRRIRHLGGPVSPPAPTPHDLAVDPPTERIPAPPPPRDTTLDLGPGPSEDAATTRMRPVGARAPEPAPGLASAGPRPEANPDATTQWVRPPPFTPPSPAPAPPASTPPPEVTLKRALILINLACLAAVVLTLIVMALRS